ncbi:tetratricopeptide repeat protein [Nonomuraea sp. NPDC046802]|uniref:tetratricopeptide repeat protein n=1 Tax=Nonomuraea sp. NPDC046802 TaxID=3154919 RepID=UPI0033E5E3A6
MASIIKLGIAGWLSSLERSNNRKDWEHREQWQGFFEEGLVDDPSSTSYIKAALTGQTSRKFDFWIESASLEDIILWKPPNESPDELSTTSSDDVEIWTWIVHRFTQTYLDSWSLVSLKREYQFVRGLWHPSFAEELLRERVIAREDVATALADRATRSEDVIDPAVLRALTQQAAALLDEGQRTAAAALFDSARMLNPADIVAQNNYAYCILVDKPEVALPLLRDALNRGIERPAVTLCNIAFAESLLGNNEAALEACQQAYESSPERDLTYLWKRGDEDWISIQTSIRPWVIEFAAELERSVGAFGKWDERLKRLRLTQLEAPSSGPSSIEKDEGDQ